MKPRPVPDPRSGGQLPGGWAMTLKILHGAYSSGYTLSAAYTSLLVDTGASLTGTIGAAGTYAGAGAAGGIGLTLPNSATATNLGVITGSAGGQGGNSGKSSYTQHGGAGGAGGDGVRLTAVGSLYNSNTITGGHGGDGGYGYESGGAGGRGGAGIELAGGGRVSNQGLIQGGQGGTDGSFYSLYDEQGGVQGGAGVTMAANGTVNNTGTIVGGAGGPSHTYPVTPPAPFGDGLVLTKGAIVTNGVKGDASAFIGGDIGIAATSGATVITNFGTIDGYGGSALVFGDGNDELFAEAGSSLIGTAVGGGGTLDIVGGVSTLNGLGATGTLSGAISMPFTGFSSYIVSGGASVTFAGADTVSSGKRLVCAGSLATAAGAVLTLATGAITQIEHAVNNAGTIKVTGSGATTLEILSAGATLTGAGTISLTGALARIVGANSASVLDNVNDWITGAGALGSGRMTLVNEIDGVIDASGPGVLTIDTLGKVMTNAGVVLASGAGGLVIKSTTVSNAGGSIIAGAGAHVVLEGAKIEGGLVGGVGSGFVEVTSEGADLGAGGATVTLDGLLRVLNGASVILEGNIDNAGKIETLGSSFMTGLTLDAPAVTLSGAGDVILGANANNRITSLTLGALTNAGNLIEGAGEIGGDALSLVNNAIIRGDQTAGLTLDTGTRTIVNTGTIENTGAGETLVKSPVNNSGTLEATRGTLAVTGVVSGAGSVRISGALVDFASTFTENVTFTSASSGELAMARSRNFTGQISGFSRIGGSTLDLQDVNFATATLSYSGTTASGTLTVTDGTHTARIRLTGNYIAAGNVFTLAKDAGTGCLVTDTTVHAARSLAGAMAGFGTGGNSIVAALPPRASPSLALLHG